MRKVILALGLFIVSVLSMNAHPIKVTLPDGRVIIVESDNFKTTEDLMKYILDLSEPKKELGD